MEGGGRQRSRNLRTSEGAKIAKVAGGLRGRQPPHDDPESDDSIRGKKSKSSGGWVGGGCRMMIEKVMIQLEAKNLQSSWGGGSPPMMIEQVMIQIMARNLKSSGRVGGGGGSPLMMIQKVMIQVGPKNLKAAGGLGGGLPHDDRKSDDSIRSKKSTKWWGVAPLHDHKKKLLF